MTTPRFADCVAAVALAGAALVAGLVSAAPAGATQTMEPVRLAQAAPPAPGVPAPHAAAIARFFGAINARKPFEAMAMLDRTLAPDARAEEAWLRQLVAIRSIAVMRIEPSALAAPPPCFAYKVTLEAYVAADPEAEIPFYGWQDNPNIRWLTLCPGGKSGWTIAGFATGP